MPTHAAALEVRLITADDLQLSMAFSGTNVTRGRGRAVVVRTGEASQLGQIAE